MASTRRPGRMARARDTAARRRLGQLALLANAGPVQEWSETQLARGRKQYAGLFPTWAAYAPDLEQDELADVKRMVDSLLPRFLKDGVIPLRLGRNTRFDLDVVRDDLGQRHFDRIEGEQGDVLAFNIALLLTSIEGRDLRMCGPDRQCRRYFIKKTRRGRHRKFCSDKCRIRHYMRAERARAKAEEEANYAATGRTKAKKGKK